MISIHLVFTMQFSNEPVSMLEIILAYDLYDYPSIIS